MSLTAQQVKDLINSLLADNTTQQIGPQDLRDVTTALADLAGAVDDTSIPAWTAALTFNTDGSGDGAYATHPDTDGKLRFWKTKTDTNLNNEPPTDPGTTENTHWIEVSPASSNPIKEWSAGLYGDGLIIVFYNDNLYKLNVVTRPYESTNIVTEISAGDWVALIPTSQETILEAKITLTQSQIQNLNTTPIEVVPAPGANKIIQVLGAVAKLNHNGTTYGTAGQLGLIMTTTYSNPLLSTKSVIFINQTTDIVVQMEPGTSPASPSNIVENNALKVGADADATNNGGTIDLWVQYKILDAS